MNGMPVAGENHKKLHRLAGRWTGAEKMSKTPFSPGGEAIGTSIMRVDIDGFFVIQDYVQTRGGKTSYKGHGIFSYDETKKTFIWYWVDSMGFVPPGPSRGQWNGDTLVFEHEPIGDKRGRYTYRFPDADSYTFQIENSDDAGKTWYTFIEAVYHRA